LFCGRYTMVFSSVEIDLAFCGLSDSFCRQRMDAG
jgi:hypothetical protein